MAEALIELAAAAIGHRRPLLEGVALRIERGDFWGVVGPNGAGKTTLAMTLLGQLPPLAGRLRWARPGLRFGYVPQRHALDPDYPLSALQVALMGRTGHFGWWRGPRAADRQRALAELRRLGMADVAEQPFRALSGGEKQRVLMARALATEPDVLVLDEPTEGIDLTGETDVMHFLRRLHRDDGLTILMIEHHMTEVISLVDHLCLINQHTGLFEAGALDALLTEQRLSSLYGRPVGIDVCAERTHVHVRDPEADRG